MPKVSIVMPTRNRAHLLKTAIKSALQQTYEDIEIVVSDNYSSDGVKTVVDSFNSPKIRYVRTEKALNMPDSWNFALSHARGEYITYLTDDSILFTDAVEKSLSALNSFGEKVIAWNLCEYLSSEFLYPKLRNVIRIPKFAFQPYVVQSEESLRGFVEQGMWHPIPTPKFMNSLCHRQVIEKAIHVQKKMFLPNSPDYASAVGVLKQVKNYVVMEQPLGITGTFKESIGASSMFNLGPATKEFLAEFDDKSFINLVEPKLPTIPIGVAQTFEIMRKYYPDLPALNRKNLIDGSIYCLLLLESNGADVADAWRILDEYLLKQPDEFRNSAKKLKFRLKIKLKLKSKIEKFVPMLFLEYYYRWKYGTRSYWGKRCGFTNLEECGKVAPKLIGKKIK